MNKESIVRGYKVFNHDWTCRDKKYTCPGKFEEDVNPSVCNIGMHFCKKAADCFNYYSFDSENRVAEVIAYGAVVEKGDKCSTNKLEIVREVLWSELLEIVNIGQGCTGYANTGDNNSGSYNSGNRNSGSYNSGNHNSGCRNSGSYNSGDYNSGSSNSGEYNSGCRNSGSSNSGEYNSGCHNSGIRNSGNGNSGDYNSGSYNSGDYNSGNYNSGEYNSGCRNSGSSNSGNRNSGDYNSGHRNSGNCNRGDGNSGDWNKCSFSNGCFNTQEPKIYLFNKPSEWTYTKWTNSEACYLMEQIRMSTLKYIFIDDMTDREKSAHSEVKTTGGYLKEVDISGEAQLWWNCLSNKEKNVITAIPNFDREIFKEITGIDVDA